MMLFVASMQSLMVALAKVLSASFSSEMVTLFYFGMPLLFMLIQQKNVRGFFNLSVSVMMLMSLRGLLSAIGVTLFLFGVSRVDFGVASVLFNSAPFFVALFAMLIGLERTKVNVYAGAGVALLGVMFIVKPSSAHAFINWIALVVLLAAILMAGAILAMKYMTNKRIPSDTIVFNYYFFATMSVLAFIIVKKFILGYDVIALSSGSLNAVKYLALIAIFGLMSLSAQLVITKAFAYLPANIASPILFTSVPISSIIGYFAWNQRLTIQEMFGILLVFSGVLISSYVRREQYATKTA